MNKTFSHKLKTTWTLALAGLLAMTAVPLLAQTDHEVVDGSYDDPGAPQAAVNTLLSSAELEELAGPIALYPDDLVSLVLPASTYPVQIVQAARYLNDRERDSKLQPPDDWDDAVVALLNYPEVIELMNDDLDWTWALGEAFLNQQAALMDAIAGFRGQAYAAGNLRSDERQVVTVDHEVIEIAPANPEVIYVPYYEPARVVVYQPYPVYYYNRYPRYSYYYPYPADYSFAFGYFFGVSTAYRLNWNRHQLYTYHYGYRGHPYYGRNYYRNHYFRHLPVRPYRPRQAFSRGGYAGDVWKPRPRQGARPRSGIRTPRSGARIANSRGSGIHRNTANRTQSNRRNDAPRNKAGYVSPYAPSKATRQGQQRNARTANTSRAPDTRRLNQQRPRQAQALKNTRPASANTADRIRTLALNSKNSASRPGANRIRSSRPATRESTTADVTRVRSSRPAVQTRQTHARPLAYTQQQRQAPANATANRTRSVVVNRQPTRVVQAAPQRRVAATRQRQIESAPQPSRPAQAAPARQARQAKERPARAQPRNEKPRATRRAAPRQR